jgi:hypothetical protein
LRWKSWPSASTPRGASTDEADARTRNRHLTGFPDSPRGAATPRTIRSPLPANLLPAGFFLGLFFLARTAASARTVACEHMAGPGELEARTAAERHGAAIRSGTGGDSGRPTPAVRSHGGVGR